MRTLAQSAVKAGNTDFPSFGTLGDQRSSSETDYSTGNTIVTLSNYQFKAGVPYLILASSGMTQVNGGTAIWESRLNCSGIIDAQRFQSLPSATQQSSIKMFAIRHFAADTTTNVTISVHRLTGDNTFRVGTPRVQVVPMVAGV